jgi:hypothetical protein
MISASSGPPRRRAHVYPDWGWGVATVGPSVLAAARPCSDDSTHCPAAVEADGPGRYRAHLPALSDPADRIHYEPAPQPADQPSHDKITKDRG